MVRPPVILRGKSATALETVVVGTALVAAALLGGCAAPVMISDFPGLTAESRDRAPCAEGEFESVRVLGVMPPEGTYEEVGFMSLSQRSTSEFVMTSIEHQVKEARIKACQWGADAIVVLDSGSDEGTTWNFFTGLQHRESKESRVVAIRLRGEGVEEPPVEIESPLYDQSRP